jgi:hypothetical protein
MPVLKAAMNQSSYELDEHRAELTTFWIPWQRGIGHEDNVLGIRSDETGEATHREPKRARTKWVTERVAHARRGDQSRELKE